MVNQTWEQANEWEAHWHKNQQFNSHNEETKQYFYASRMGFDPFKTEYYGQISWDFGQRTMLDMGGSGQSILLKVKAKKRVVVDPVLPSDWMLQRYKEAGIEFIQAKGEDFKPDEVFDEVVMMNTLQHTDKPEVIVKNILSYSRLVRVFELINHGISEGHIHNLTEQELNKWFGAHGQTEYFTKEPNSAGYYYGLFI